MAKATPASIRAKIAALKAGAKAKDEIPKMQAKLTKLVAEKREASAVASATRDPAKRIKALELQAEILELRAEIKGMRAAKRAR